MPLAPGPIANSCGLDLRVQANDNGIDPITGEPIYALDVAGGIIMSSTRDGSGSLAYAAENVGGGTVNSDFAMIRGSGDYTTVGGSTFQPNPTSGHSGPVFLDPTRGKPDPPVTTDILTLVNWDGGALVGSSDPANPKPIGTGIHFPTRINNNGPPTATGDPLVITGYVEFVPEAFPGDTRTFGEFIFPGGVDIRGANETAPNSVGG